MRLFIILFTLQLVYPKKIVVSQPLITRMVKRLSTMLNVREPPLTGHRSDPYSQQLSSFSPQSLHPDYYATAPPSSLPLPVRAPTSSPVAIADDVVAMTGRPGLVRTSYSGEQDDSGARKGTKNREKNVTNRVHSSEPVSVPVSTTKLNHTKGYHDSRSQNNIDTSIHGLDATHDQNLMFLHAVKPDDKVLEPNWHILHQDHMWGHLKAPNITSGKETVHQLRTSVIGNRANSKQGFPVISLINATLHGGEFPTLVPGQVGVIP